MLPKIATDIMFSLIKAKIATDFMVFDFHAVISKAVSMRKKQHLVACETVISWKKKIVLAIVYILHNFTSATKGDIHRDMKNQCKVPWLLGLH